MFILNFIDQFRRMRPTLKILDAVLIIGMFGYGLWTQSRFWLICAVIGTLISWWDPVKRGERWFVNSFIKRRRPPK